MRKLLGRREVLLGAGALPLAACLGGTHTALDSASRATRASIFQAYPNAAEAARLSSANLIFPKMTKASFVVGGVYGNGSMFAGDNIVGHYNVTGVSAGLQAGFQQFSMMIFFMTPSALAEFRGSLGVEFGSDVEYALPNQGISIGASTATYNREIYALIFNQSGIMAGASIEGAKYTAI